MIQLQKSTNAYFVFPHNPPLAAIAIAPYRTIPRPRAPSPACDLAEPAPRLGGQALVRAQQLLEEGSLEGLQLACGVLRVAARRQFPCLAILCLNGSWRVEGESNGDSQNGNRVPQGSPTFPQFHSQTSSGFPEVNNVVDSEGKLTLTEEKGSRRIS